MTDRYDDIERKFGIAAYCSPHEGFAAVVKARYSDFVVHEGVRALSFSIARRPASSRIARRLLCLDSLRSSRPVWGRDRTFPN